jgi:hypothetical protein
MRFITNVTCQLEDAGRFFFSPVTAYPIAAILAIHLLRRLLVCLNLARSTVRESTTCPECTWNESGLTWAERGELATHSQAPQRHR